MNIKTLLKVVSTALFVASTSLAQAQTGTVINHAFAIGKGPGITGYTSLLCTSAQLAVGQAAADPLCRDITGDATLAATGALTLATVNANVGSFGSATLCPTLTVNAKGLVTGISAATCTPAVGSITGLGTGVATWLATPSSANLRSALTDETGTGLAYFQGGDLGTPSAGVLTNATGLPISTGVSGLGTGCATFLGTPSSANLRSCLTDEVGTGAAYFVGGALGTPASATLTNATGLPLAGLAPQSANTIVANATAGSASPTAVSVPSCSGANQALNWTAGTGPGCVTISGGGGGGGTITSKTANYTITTSDCGNTIQAGTGATGFFTVTLPAVAGFTAGCEVTVINADTGRGKKLSGFPTDISTILWPLQVAAVKVNAAGTAWVTSLNPGRWKMPSQITFHVDVTNGSNANDGLATGAGNAVQTAQAAYSYIMNQTDTQTTSPIIAMTCSQTHTTALQMGGTPLGTNLIQVSPDGNCTFTWSNAGACIILADLAELDLKLNQYGSSGNATFACNSGNTAATGAINLHNDVVVDIESGAPVVWTPGGANDDFLYCDGMCQFTIANGIQQSASTTGGRLIRMSAGGHGTFSGATTPGASTTIGGMFYLFGSAVLNLGTTGNTGWTSIGTTNVWANSTIVTNGITPQGGYSIGASAAACTGLAGPTC